MTCREYRLNSVKQLSLGLLLFVVSCVVALAKPTPVPPIYINTQPITPPELPPQVDAAIFVNRSLLVTSNNSLYPTFPPFVLTPYEAQSVRFWTNNGTMVGLPGFNLEYIPNPAHLTALQRRKRGANLPQPSASFFNDGQIIASDILNINAKQLVNQGVLAGDTRSRIRIRATNGFANLSRSAVHTGDLPMPSCVNPSNFIFGPFFFGVFDPAVTYLYLDSGISGFVNTNRSPLQLDALVNTNIIFSNFFFGLNFSAPSPDPPNYQYRQITALFPGAPITNIVTNISATVQSCGLYDVFVHTQTNAFVFGTNVFTFGRDISVVFVPTNGLSTNVTIGVAFPTNAFFIDAPIVEFRSTGFDVIQQKAVTNYLTFRDDGASIFRGHDCTFDTSDPPNAPFTTDLFYTTDFETNFVDYTYTVAYAQVGNTNSIYFTNVAPQFLFFPELGRSPAASDPTNNNGTVFIQARDLDLTQARIRGENGVFIQASNLIGISSASLDAPFVSFDASTTNNTLLISNFFRPQANRLQATLNSWAGSWAMNVTNGFFTNTVLTTNGTFTNIVVANVEVWNYHVLILGACVDELHPSVVHQLALQAPNVVIDDKLAINNAFKIVGQSLTFGSNSALALPVGASLAFTNVIRVTSFTNEGIVNVPDSAFFGAFEEGYVPPKPKRNRKRNQEPRLVTYENFVNRNIVSAASVSARAAYVENVGHPFVPALITATNGVAQLDGASLIISNAVISASGDVVLTAGDLLATQSRLNAGATNAGRFTNAFLPGSILIDATNSLTDGGLNASNDWRVTTGIRLARRPGGNEAGAVGDLMGTRIVVRSGTFVQSTIQWAGEDRGTTVGGFVNNLAVGRLVLDGALGNLFQFQGAASGQAIYVDYLELLNAATNYNFAVGVDPGFTVYFADSNISPEKLEEVGAGRIRWVSDFTGPQSSTNIVYPDGTPHTFNAGLVRSKDRDDDGDGVVNAEDCTPLPVPGFDSTLPCVPPPAPVAAAVLSIRDVALSITAVAGRRQVVLNWEASANSNNTVEFSDSLDGRAWRTLTNFVNGPVSARVSVRDAVGTPLRVYRVRVDAGRP